MTIVIGIRTKPPSWPYLDNKQSSISRRAVCSFDRILGLEGSQMGDIEGTLTVTVHSGILQ